VTYRKIGQNMSIQYNIYYNDCNIVVEINKNNLNSNIIWPTYGLAV
jgi:hypothetical protein